MEEDNQKGLAHFLEHMAFNGTKNYPEKGMLDYLESKGAKFGRDINAYTSFDETVYNISNIPVNNLKVLDSSLLEEIREKEGGIYGVRVQNSSKRIPYQGAGLTFSFDCKPENATKLKAIAMAEIKKFKEGSVNQEDLIEIKNNLLKERSEYTKKLNYWHGKLVNYGKYNEFNMTDIAYNDFIKNINAKEVVKKANGFFDDAIKVEVIMSSKDIDE